MNIELRSVVVKGIEEKPVTEWLSARVDNLGSPLKFELITGGHSNLTYRVTDNNDRKWVLRRPPLGHVLEGAHDMVREHRLLSSLDDSDVPVPPVVGLCTDSTINGADFYVTEFVEGYVLRDQDSASDVATDKRPVVGPKLIEALAAIHSVDLEATSLADLGKREDYVARQLRTWLRQFNAMTSRKLPVIEEVHDVLTTNIPEQREATLIHGDFRLDNCLVSPQGEVAAVLDWEISTLGDPLADLGILLAYWSEQDDQFLPLGDAATIYGGFSSRQELVTEYGRVTGRDTSDMDFFFAFASWRLACILEGVHARYVGGANPEIPEEVEIFPQSVVYLAERAAEILGL
ncbi:MAG: phosphotransferase family protein [Acidimicrobiaceae bacterium]|nr:phosphotransferase family protein [Acidimicrobiaceae bacterium]